MPKIHTKQFPWFSESDMNRREHVLSAAKLMMNAAHTAPITGGVDHLEAELIWGEKELSQLAERYEEQYVKVDGQWMWKEIKGDIRFFTPYDQGWVKAPWF